MAQTRKALKVPPVLATLGYVCEIKGETVHYPYKKKDDVRLFATPNGKTLWCIKTKENKADFDRFSAAWNKNKGEAEKAAKLYEDWHDFDVQSGSLMSPPKGFLFFVDRCVSIIYSSDKWGGKRHKYIHTFDKPPMIWVNRKTAPTVIKLSGGAIATTKRGITG